MKIPLSEDHDSRFIVLFSRMIYDNIMISDEPLYRHSELALELIQKVLRTGGNIHSLGKEMGLDQRDATDFAIVLAAQRVISDLEKNKGYKTKK